MFNKKYARRFRNDTPRASTIDHRRYTEDRFPEEAFLIPSCSEIKIFRWKAREEKERSNQDKQKRVIAVFFLTAINLITATIFTSRRRCITTNHFSRSRHPFLRRVLSTSGRKSFRNSSFSAAIALSFRVLRLFSRVSKAARLCSGW